MANQQPIPLGSSPLDLAVQNESDKFLQKYKWLEKAMPKVFFEEVEPENIMLITHNLMGFDLQDFYSTINLKRAAIVLCLDSSDADIRVLENYQMYGIKNYQTYVSSKPPPFPRIKKNLRVATIYFTEAIESKEQPFSKDSKNQLQNIVKEHNPDLSNEDFDQLFLNINTRFLNALPHKSLALAFDLFFRAQNRDTCQYEVKFNKDWKENKKESLQIMLAWRNTPKHNFLYRLARTIHRHDLIMKRVTASYINPYGQQNILIMALNLHGSDGRAVWDVCKIPDFLRELVTVKYFASFDLIDQRLVSQGIISGNMGNVLRSLTVFVHQALVHVDQHQYSLENIDEAICRHPELTAMLCEAFQCKFNPSSINLEKFQEIKNSFLRDVETLDTGHEDNDVRRKNVLQQGMNFITHTLKTNVFRSNLTAHSFRLDPKYIDLIPFDRLKKFPELPFAVIFIKGMHFFGFHIRFKDLSRGGLRTILPQHRERMLVERNTVFTECYNLALTQHRKNKDIPEGGAKGVLFLKPYERLESEAQILKRELEDSEVNEEEIEEKLTAFRKEQTIEYLYQAQRSYIESLLVLVNCNSQGELRAKNIVDYLKRAEDLYLGPDENMHDSMIQWVADFSKGYDYKPGSSFISGKPKGGINHKAYGVTSQGVNVYMDEVLKYLDINPKTDRFTIKMSGGPDGDVAGNQIVNLQKFYPKTAKLIALTDVSGTIQDLNGLDLNELIKLFQKQQPIREYPSEKLSEGGFLLNKNIKRDKEAFVQQTLCLRKVDGKIIEDWLSGSDANHLLKYNIYHTPADVFIPAGGRPRSIKYGNYTDFIDEKGCPTAKIIIEGANLYLTPRARKALEEKGVLIVKDSSANKTGVICSSFEVLSGLAIGTEEFEKIKEILIKEIQERTYSCALNEATLLLKTHKETGLPLTKISDQISERINQYCYQILDHLENVQLSSNPNDPLIKSFLKYCLPLLKNNYKENLLKEIPEHHKKAIIACYIASSVVYKKGLSWSPAIVDILPLVLQESS